MPELNDQERDEIIEAIRAGRSLPAQYRASLFADALETELIWPGKTNEVERVVLPFQSIEHIDEPRSGTVRQPDLFSFSEMSGRQTGGWTNKLIWGDNKLILSSLVNGPLRREIENAGGLKLVYIDPPFDVGADFSIDVQIGIESVTKQPSIVEEVAYRDTWGRGRDSYVGMMYERLSLIYNLLASDGSMYVHVDSRVCSHIKLILDEIFGPECFQREIVWRIGWVSGYKSAANNWIRNHDTILYYVKNPEHFTFNKIYIPYPDGYTRRDGSPPSGKGYPIEDVWNASPVEFELAGEDSLDSIQIKSFSREKTGYATQKNESLIRRIVQASSNPGDLVADFFCGSGTTLSVSEKLGRKWLGVDLGRFAIHTSRKRLIGVQRDLASKSQPYRAFEILNLGSYERQHFISRDSEASDARVAASNEEMRSRFIDLVMSAYGGARSEQLPGFDGTKGTAAVIIGPIDAAVTEDSVRKAIDSAKKAGITRLDILAFDFEMGIKPVMQDNAKDEGVTLTLRYIPNDVFDKRAITKGQVKFYDVGYLEVKPKQAKDGAVTIELEEFGVFYVQDDADAAASGLRNGGSRVVVDGGQVVRVSKDKKGIIKKEVLTKSWTDWIDYWAVDFDFESQKEIIRVTTDEGEKDVWTGRYIFENQWQDFRTRDSRELRKVSDPHTYDTPGEYKIAVKVVDVFGNDTTKVVKLKVK